MILAYTLLGLIVILYGVTIGLQIRAARKVIPTPTLEDIAAVSERVTALEVQTATLRVQTGQRLTAGDLNSVAH